MKKAKAGLGLILATTVAFLLSSCATTKGGTDREKKEFVDKMEKQALEDLYAKHPEARDQIQHSAGYAVFSNISTNLIFVTTKGGYGVAIDRVTGERTYMKMAAGGVGLGAGIRDARWIMIFKKDHDFGSLVDNGWDVSGEAGAAVKSDRQGISGSMSRSADKDIITYQLTKAGIAVGVSLEGSKFWPYEDLNEISRLPASR